MASAPSFLEALADNIKTLVTHVNLNVSDPGTTGAGEQAGARVAATWSDVDETDGTVTLTATITVDAGQTVTHYSAWSALTAGTYRTGKALPAAQAFPTGGTYALTVTFPLTDAP